MVFKNFIHYLINKYLKNYIERLDYEKLQLNLKNGNVLLENLHLKPEALAYFNIPATVAFGYIEQLKLTIPWKNLSSKPTEVHINGLYVLIVPKKELIQDLSEHYADKMGRVQQKLEKMRKVASDNGKLDKKDSVLVERMRSQVMQNLVLTVENLHISYEMKSPTKLGHPFSFGVTLHYLELTTENNLKLSQRFKGSTFLNYKIREINLLSIYWNTICQSRLGMPFDDVLNDLKSKIATNIYKPNDNEMNYILRPVNLTIESLITLKSKEHYYERSRLIFDIQIGQIDLHVDSKQISDVLDFVKFQNYTTIYDRCREYRELLLQNSLGYEPLTSEQKQRIQFLESKLDIFHLAYIRHKLETEMNLFSPMTEYNDIDQQIPVTTVDQSASTDNHRHHRWDPLTKKVKNKLNNLTKVLDYSKSLLATAAYIPNEQELYFEDVPKIDVEINVSEVNLNLLSTVTNMKSTIIERKDEIIASITTNNARINLKRMAVSSRIECLIDLQFLRMFGMRYNKNHQSMLLLEMLPSASSHVHIEFELFPEDQKSDYRLHLTIEPFKIIYDAPTINRIVECFEANGLVVRHSPTPIKQRTFMEMKRDIPYMKVFDIKMHFKGVKFVVPQYGVYQEGLPMVRMAFSDMILRSCLDDSNDPLFQEKVEERQFYAKYKLEFTDLRIIYSQSNRPRLYVLQRTPLIDISFYKCIYSDDAYLTKWRIGIQTAMGEMTLSKILLRELILHLNSIPLLHSNIIAIMKRINFYFVIFSPRTTMTADLSIYNCSLRLLTQPQRSIRTDFHICMSKTRDEYSTTRQAMITLNEPTMIRCILSALNQSSKTFYRNEHIKLIYSDSITDL